MNRPNQILPFITALALGACGDNFSPQPDPAELDIDTPAGIDEDDSGAIIVGEDGKTATFSLALTRAPSAAVTMSVTSSDETAGIASASELTFTAANYLEPQSIEITSVDDDIAGGDRPFSIHLGQLISEDSSYHGIPGRTLSFVSHDDDVAGIAISDNSGMTTESNGTATFKIALTSEPLADVVLSLASDDSSEGWYMGALALASGGTASFKIDPTLTFTAADWNQPQTVTVMGADDNLDDGTQSYNIEVSADSDDASYAAQATLAVPMLNADNDTAGIAMTAISGPTTEAGGTASFDVVLESEPFADVTVSMASTKPGEGRGPKSGLTFTAANWSQPQTAQVIGIDDSIDDGDADYQITAKVSSNDSLYAAISPSPVAVTNFDDDTAGITVGEVTGLPTESGGTASFGLNLSSEPIADVVLTLAVDDASEGSLSDSEMTFTAADWDEPRTITVTGIDDDIDDGTQSFNVTATAASDDLKYSALEPAKVALTNADNDTAGVTVAKISGPTTETGGASSFGVVLGSEPIADVTLTFASSDETEGTASAPITFTSESWDLTQTVTVTGVDDAIDDGDVEYSIEIAIASNDEQYAAMAIDPVAVTNTDDDTAAVAMSSLIGSTSEAGDSATFDVVLESEPTAEVVVTLSSSDTGEGSISASLAFTSDNWDLAQTATVTGVDDLVDDGDVSYDVKASVASTDLVYNTLAVAPLSFTNLDNDTANVAVSAISGNTTEDGTTATFTVALDTQPVSEVFVSLAVDDTTEGSLDKTELSFTELNWFEAQTVTVTGLSDSEADGDVTYNVTFAVISQDAEYNEMAVSPLAVTNEDVAVCQADFTFDDGTTNGFTLIDTANYAMAATTGAAAVGSHGLELSGGNFASHDGALTTFASQQPGYVAVRMRAEFATLDGSTFFVLGDDNTSTNSGILRLFERGGEWLIETPTGAVRLSLDARQYTHFELELDWSARTMDVFANGNLIINNHPFLNAESVGVTQLHLFNFEPAIAQYDEITIGCN